MHDRYYYSILGGREKKVYKLIYEGIEKFDDAIEVPALLCVGVKLDDIVQKILLDNPHLFFVDAHYKIESNLFSSTVKLNYLYNKTDTAILTEKVKKVCNKILSQVKGKTDFEKELSLHYVLARNVLYDDIAKADVLKYHARSNTILGVLFYKTAVCEGIAKTFKLLLNALNIKCIVSMGRASNNSISGSDPNEYHAWNIVKIDGKAYHVDLTWDINLSTKDLIRHTYFNLTDNDISVDHTAIENYPSCDAKDNNYFYKNNLVVKCKSDLYQLIANTIKRGESSVEFRVDKNLSAAKSSIASFVSDCIRNITNSQQAYSIYSFEPTGQNIYCFMWEFK